MINLYSPNKFSSHDLDFHENEISEQLEFSNNVQEHEITELLELPNSDLFNAKEIASSTPKNIWAILSMIDEMRTLLDVTEVEEESTKFITVKDYNYIIKTLNNYVDKFPEESKIWFSEIQDKCDQFLKIKAIETENHEHINEVNKSITSIINDLKNSTEKGKLLVNQRTETKKTFNEKKTKLESDLKIKQNQVHEKLTLVRNPATLESFNTVAKFGSIFSAIAVAKFMKDAEIPCVIAAGIGFIACRQITNLASDYRAAVDSKNILEIELEDLNDKDTSAEKKFNQELESYLTHCVNKNDEHQILHQKTMLIQIKKDEVQESKNKMITNLMEKVFMENINALRCNAELLSEIGDNKTLQLQSYSLLKSIVGSILTIYFTKADDIQKQLTELQKYTLDEKESYEKI